MEDDCFNCARTASESYDLILDSRTVVEDVRVCEDCVSEFEEEDWIDVEECGSDS